MRNPYLKILVITSLLIGGFGLHAQSIFGPGNLKAKRSASNCDVSNPSGGFSDGIECNEANGEIAANDILVPAGSNLTLTNVMANMVMEEGVTITSATIWIFYDDYGYPDHYPGYEHSSLVESPASHNIIMSDYGMDMQEVLWDLSTPFFLEGNADYDTRYWVGISATTSDGSTPFWEMTGHNSVGQPAAFSTGSWFDLNSSGYDGAYIFTAECQTMAVEGEVECDFSIASAGFTEGISCNAANGEIVANDILVPAEQNLNLNSVMANMMVDEGVTITEATIWIFYDEWGYPYMYPGYELTSQAIAPSSLTSQGSADGMDFYEVMFDLDPILLEGDEEFDTRYWVGISATTSDGSDPVWEITDSEMISQPASNSSGDWFNHYDPNKDGTYAFFGTCEPLNAGGGVECDISNPGDGFAEGISCNAANDEIVANDILVPAEQNLNLNSVMANMMVDEGVTITEATVWIFYDEWGYPYMYPGYELTSQTIVPSSLTAQGSADGMDFYEVMFDLDPIVLEGDEEFDSRYWVGISATTSDGSNPLWEITDSDMVGQPASNSSGDWFAHYDSNKDGTYTFFAECGPMSGTDPGDDPVEDPGYECETSLEGDIDPVGDGQNCRYNSQVVANDIRVPAGSDKVLESVLARLILNSGATTDGVSVRFYEDNDGLPGAQIMSDWVHAASHELVNTYGDKEAYDVLIEFDPVFLSGSVEAETVYWIGIGIMTTDGSSPFWEVTYDNSMGHPTAVNSGGNFMIPNVQQDGVYTFGAQCYDIGEFHEPNEGFCAFNDFDINQNEDTDCFGYVSQGGFFQSFTAVQDESSGAGIKLTEGSRGMEVTLSIWDGLSNQGGTMLTTMTAHTYGGQWVDVFWDAPLALIPGEMYYLRIEGDDDLSCVRISSDIYSGGEAYSAFQSFPDYDFTFRTHYCNDLSCTQQDYGQTGAYENGVLTSKDQSNLLVTDIVVPVGENFTLERVKYVLWVLPGASITDADITLYADNNGTPGEVLNTMDEVPVYSEFYLTNSYGYDIYEVEFALNPIELQGHFDTFSTYWISLNVGTNYGSAIMSTVSTGQQGYASYESPDNGVTWEEIEGWETYHTFYGSCEPIYFNPCPEPQIDIAQLEGTDCISTPSYGGVVQSFTAETPLSAGAAIKFKAPSLGSEVSLAIWDELPNAGGSMLASKSTETNGQNWMELFWDQVIELTTGETYFLIIDGDSNLPCIAGTQESVYDGGHVFGSGNDDYPPYPSLDFVFRIYSCAEVVDEYESTCEEENPNDFTFETGFQSALNANFITANDITVPEGEDFTLTRITASFVTPNPIFYADVIYYQDNGGAPGEEIGSESSVYVVNQKVLGQRQGTDVYEAVFDVSPFLFEGLYDESVTYWIALRVANTSHSDIYWVATSATAQGYPGAQSEDGGAWMYPNSQLDCIYMWEGECNEIADPVGVEYHKVSGFSFYPNPSNNMINLKSKDAIESLEIYNIFGQRLIQEQINATNSTVEISDLSPGTYLLKVSVNGKIGTYKLVKI